VQLSVPLSVQSSEMMWVTLSAKLSAAQ